MKSKSRPWLPIAIAIAAIGGGGVWWWQARDSQSHDEVIQAAGGIYEMDPAVIKAVIWRESRFKEDARGAAGELGLMQIRDAAANEWAKAEKINNFHHGHLINAKSNVLAGTWYLKKWLKRAPHPDNPLPFALAAYNAGPGKAREWAKDTNSSAQFIERIDYPATKDYVLSVQEKAAEYRTATAHSLKY